MVRLLIFNGVLAVVSIPPIRRVMTPGPSVMGMFLRAMEQFYARWVNAIAERRGVFIFASLKDRIVWNSHRRQARRMGTTTRFSGISLIRDGRASTRDKAQSICDLALSSHSAFNFSRAGS